MIPDERRRRLLHLVEDQGSTSIAVLTEELGVSHMTIRRDVKLLEESGRLVSVTGGVAMPSRLTLDAPHRDKLSQHPEEKKQVAARAAQLITPGNLIYLDAGTTTLALAHYLVRHHHQDLDVVTNDLEVAAAAGMHPRARVHVLGGRLDAKNMSTDGPLAAAELAEFNIDVAFISASSFDLRGLSVPSQEKAVVKRAIVEHSARSFLATDASKYGRVAAFKALGLDSFDGIISDDALPQPAQEKAQELGVELLLTAVDGPHVERTHL